MSDDLGFPHDHGEVAWGHFLAQHLGKVNTENFVKSFYGPLNTLDGILNDLYTERWIETATGSALDGIGSIVGISRVAPFPVYLEFFGFASQPAGRAFGVAPMRHYYESFTTTALMSDGDYRTAIKLKIALNNGHGTAEEIMYAFDTAFKVIGTKVLDAGNGTGTIVVPKVVSTTDPEYYLAQSLIPGAAGVKFYITFAGSVVFGFANYSTFYGFGVGVMATSLATQETEIATDE
jgi:hypothetical protein